VGPERLFLIRHGEAEESHPSGDRHRSLSAGGRRTIAALLPRARDAGLAATLALSSPYLRAVQTRELFLPLLGSPRLAESPVFTPSAHPRDAADELAAWGEWSAVALFTHNPLVTALADHLLGHPVPDLEFHPATILALVFPSGFGPGRGEALWLIQP
jgi:phosphohistidine phosphatase